MRLIVLKFLLATLGCLMVSSGIAKTVEFNQFERLSDQLGGRQSSVYAIYRSSHDFLWFATDTDGVLRYDGYNYESWSQQLFPSSERVSYSSLLLTADERLWAATWGNGLVSWNAKIQAAGRYVHNADNSASLRDDRVQTLFQDSQQRLWVGTLNGLSYLAQADDGEWQMRGLPAAHPLRTQRIWWLAESNDYLWVATSQGLYRLNSDLSQWQHYLLNAAEQGPNRQNEIRTVAVFAEEVWIGTDFGVFFFDQERKQFDPVTYPAGATNLSQVRSNVLVADPYAAEDGTFWSGGWGGLYLIDRERKQYIELQEGWNKLADVDVRSIAFDSVGDMWVGARDQGIFFGRRDRQNFSVPIDAQQLAELGLSGQRATNVVYYGLDDDLWLGFAEGVLHQDAQTQAWQMLHFPAEDFVNQVETIFVDATDTLWVATNTQLYRADATAPTKLERFTLLHEQLELTDQAVNAIVPISDEELLLAFWGQGIARFNLVSQTATWEFQGLVGLRGNQVYDIAYLEQYGYFAATRYSGVFQRTTTSEEWRATAIKPPTASGGDDFLCVYAEPPATLWFCSGEGVWRVNLADGTQQLLSMADGLPSDRVVGVHGDAQGSIWLLTSLGLARYDAAAQRLINFGLNDGLPAEVMLRQAVDTNSQGMLTVGSVQGAFSLKPAALSLNTRNPQVALTQLVVSGTDRSTELGFAASQITLAPEERSLLVQYSVLDFHDAARNSGRYRLLGASEKWSDWSFSREISFAGLAAGDYVLQIEGRNSQGIVSAAPTELEIRVLRPWWQSIWVLALAIVMLGVAVYLLLRLRFRALEAANKRLDEEVQARTRELEQANAQLLRQSQTDPLTGILNRRGFSERFLQAQRQLAQRQQSIALALLDVDYFKQVNDRHGHDVGDAVLQAIAGVLQERLRKDDVIARWGGEEFILLLPNTDVDSAERVCEALRKAIAELSIHLPEEQLKVTATFGVTAEGDAKLSLEQLLKRADDALYQGKSSGRDQVVVR
jgi:diguanylate cyclase (GGDEF)-like protein